MKSRLAKLEHNLFCVCLVFTFGKERCPLFRCTFPIFISSGVVCVTDILLNIPGRSVVLSVGGFVWSPCGR